MLNKIQISFAINILIIVFGFTALVPEIVTASSNLSLISAMLTPELDILLLVKTSLGSYFEKKS